jgi:hypothetical protein
MTVPDDMRAHHLYCAAHLARLRLEAEAETERGVPLPPALAQQVTQVTRMILAEAEAGAPSWAPWPTAAGPPRPRGSWRPG